MKTLGNILWLVPFLGFVDAILVYLMGLLLTATVIAAPIGLGLMEFGKFLFSPFGHAMVSRSDLRMEQNKGWKTYSTIVRVLYFPFGVLGAVTLAFQIAGLFLSLFGIPAALVLAKSVGTCFNPVNKKCVPQAVATELEKRRSHDAVRTHLGNASLRTLDTGSSATWPAPRDRGSCLSCGQPVSESTALCPACAASPELASSHDVAHVSSRSSPTGLLAELGGCSSCGAPRHKSGTERFCRRCGAMLVS